MNWQLLREIALWTAALATLALAIVVWGLEPMERLWTEFYFILH